jgi:hypothetical protein
MSLRTHWAALIVCCAACLARADDKPPAAPDTANPLGQLQQQFMMQFDVNKDGKLSGQEQMMAQEAMRRQGINLGIAPGGFPGADQFQKMFDRDGDGKLSPTEAFAAQAMFQRMRGGGMHGGVVRGGSGGTVMPPQGFMPAAPQGKATGKVSPLVKRFDKNGDGKLNAEEKAAAQAELKKDKDKPEEAKKEKEKPAKKGDK